MRVSSLTELDSKHAVYVQLCAGYMVIQDGRCARSGSHTAPGIPQPPRPGAAGLPDGRAPLRYKRRPSVITNAFHRLYPDIHDYMYRGKSHELSQCRSGSN